MRLLTVRNSAGHIQETWKNLSYPKFAQATLAALANTIRYSKEYVSISSILKTIGKISY